VRGIEAARAQAQLDRLTERQERSLREAEIAQALATEADTTQAELDALRQSSDELRGIADSVPEAEVLLARVRKEGWLDRIAEWDRLNERVVVLDKELEAIEREQERLREDLARERAPCWRAIPSRSAPMGGR
jgi:hypothetical protein